MATEARRIRPNYVLHIEAMREDVIDKVVNPYIKCANQTTYKLGFVSYIPKPDAPDTQAPNLRPVTLLPVFFKIFSKYITFVAYETTRKTI